MYTRKNKSKFLFNLIIFFIINKTLIKNIFFENIYILILFTV